MIKNNLSSLITTGPGSNTVKIPSSGGLYSYNPAYWWGYCAGQTGGGFIKWTPFGQTKNIALKVDDSSQFILPFNGLYEFTISGSVNVKDKEQSISMLKDGDSFVSQPLFYNSTVTINSPSTTPPPTPTPPPLPISVLGWTSASFTAFVNVVIPNTYIQYSLTNGIELSITYPLVVTVKFMSLL